MRTVLSSLAACARDESAGPSRRRGGAVAGDSQRTKLRPALAFVLAAAGLAGRPPPAAAQAEGQVTQLTITEPAPAQFNAQTPFRTNRDIIRIRFTHNGASGSYFITTDGADVDGSTFLPQPTDTSGDVLAGFLAEGIQTINLILLQTRLNVVAQTNVPVVVAFDRTPPTLLLTSIRVGGMAGMGGQVFGLQAPAGVTDPLADRTILVTGASNPFRTRADSLEISATASDNFTPLADVQVRARIPQSSGTQPASPVPQVPGQPGTFLIAFTLANQPDGLYDLTVTANDQVNDPAAPATLQVGNTTGRAIVQIIRDTTAPRISRIEIARPLTGTTDSCGKPAQTLTTGTGTFIGNETVGIQFTFSEPITPPRVTVQQNTGQEIPLTPTVIIAGRAERITYSFTPVPIEAQNGPVTLRVSGRNVGTNNANDPGEGTDEAGNGITPTNTAALQFASAFIVDTVGPDLRRGIPANQQTVPAQGAVLTAETFPQVLRAQVVDYNTSTGTALARDFASGVDFTQVAAQGPTAATSAVGPLNIQLTGPRGAIPAQPAVPLVLANPPTEISLNLGSLEQLYDNEGNFQRDPRDGRVRPREGTYTMTVNMIDRVCNTSRRQITFTVDTTPVREDSVRVFLDGVRVNRRGDCVPADTSGQPRAQHPVIRVTSIQPDFSATGTTFEVDSCISGNDSPCYPTVLTTPVRGTTTVEGQPTGFVEARPIGVERVDPVGINFPRPSMAPATTVPAGELDPRIGLYDGPEIIAAAPSDVAGNRGVITTDGRRLDTTEFIVNLDTLIPFTQVTFPRDNSAISGPVRFVDATLFDPPARRIPRTELLGDFANPQNVAAFRWVPGCGIDINRSNMALKIENVYQPGRVDLSLINEPNAALPFNGPGRIRGTLRFIHIPNATDPTQPTFSPADDRFKVLLEITDRNQNVRTLPTDGGMDGIYSIGVVPVDRAGNRLLSDPLSLNNPGAAVRRGTYFGLQPSNTTTIDLTAFYFLYDNARPRLEVDNFPEGVLLGSFNFARGPVLAPSTGAAGAGAGAPAAATSAAPVLATARRAQNVNDFPRGPFIGGTRFRITGFVTDLSAKNPEAFGSAGNNLQGGAGMSHVEYSLALVDRNFNVVRDPAICPSPAVDASGNPNTTCANPIIPLRRGTLGPINGALDPVPTTTNPWIGGATQFATLQRPRHRFAIDDELPPIATIPTPRASPAADFYLFTIRAVDRAGNQTELLRRVRLDPRDLQPPPLIAPRNGSFVNRQVTEFSWGSLADVTTYTISVDFPDGNNLTRDVNATRTFLALPREGLHTWNVRARDAVGNVGPPGDNFSFIVDRTAPRVENVIVADNVDPVRRSGRLHIGDVFFTVEFTEDLNPEQPPQITFTPPGLSLGPQPVTTERFLGATYLGRGNIPPAARPDLWDGTATIQIVRAEDLAGNVLTEQPPHTFEIDTGPDVATRFFFNPVAPQEIVVVVLATEELKVAPRLTELSGLAQISNQAFSFQRANRAYYSAFTLLNPRVASTVSFTVASEDLEGNSSRRLVSFTVTPLSATATARAVSADRSLTLDLPAGSVAKDMPLYVLPPVDPTRKVASQARGLFVRRSGHAAAAPVKDAAPPADQALKILSYAHELAPQGAVLARDARVSLALAGMRIPRGVPASQIGLYVYDGARWAWAGGATDGRTIVGTVRTLGPLAIALDQTPPVLSGLSVKDGEELASAQPTITGSVSDGGSGVSRDGLTVLLDDKPVAFTYREQTGDLAITPEKPLARGRHSLVVAARDRAGNVTRQAPLAVIAPDGFGLREAVAYPNPARTFSRIRVGLTQPGATARVSVDIFDVTGRRLRRLSEAGPFAGRNRDLTWALDTEDGHGVASGVYFFRVGVTSTSGQTIRTRGKLAVLR
jgi:hypothetical protein